MELKTCEHGHTYDPAVNPECPECRRLGYLTDGLSSAPAFEDIGATAPLGGGSFDYPAGGPAAYDATAPIPVSPAYGMPDTMPPAGGYAEPLGKTQPLRRNTVPAYAPPTWQPGAPGGQTSNPGAAAEPYDVTKPRYVLEGSKVHPVTGWLVCVEGPEKGQDYRLHEDYNYIGRSPDADVCIRGDDTISRERQAVLVYDDRERVFAFGPNNTRTIVRHNGKAVLNQVELQKGDRIEIGSSVFCFIPFCGEDFQW